MMLLCCWAEGYKDPLYLVTPMASADEACHMYAKRFRIETFLADQKSRGFHVYQSHLSDPTRLAVVDGSLFSLHLDHVSGCTL